MGVEDILVFYHLSFKDMFVFSTKLWKCRTREYWSEEKIYLNL